MHISFGFFSLNLDISSVARSLYTSSLTMISTTHSLDDCDLKHYYEAVEVNVYEDGCYILTSNSSIDLNGYLYTDHFDPFNLSTNLIKGNDNSLNDLQFQIIVDLIVNTTYILIVGTRNLNEKKPFSIIVSGLNNVSLRSISFGEYLLYLYKIKHKHHVKNVAYM
jgi:hypothetical protein